MAKSGLKPKSPNFITSVLFIRYYLINTGLMNEEIGYKSIHLCVYVSGYVYVFVAGSGFRGRED